MKRVTGAADLTWDDLRVAVAAARTGSLSGASRRLGVSVPTVGRRLERLEAALGLKLFQRHPAGLTITPEARALLGHADGVAERIDELLRAAAAGASTAEGTVTVTTIETVITHVVAPRLADFRLRYPRLQLVLRSSTTLERLDRLRADVAVRVVRPNEARLVGKKLATQTMGLFGTEAYFARKGRPRHPGKDLAGHDVVAFEGGWDSLPEMVWLAERLGDTPPAFRVGSIAATTEVVRSGAALGILPVGLSTEGLVLLVGAESIPARDLWLVMHEDLRRAPPVRAVATFLEQAFADFTAAGAAAGGAAGWTGTRSATRRR